MFLDNVKDINKCRFNAKNCLKSNSFEMKSRGLRNSKGLFMVLTQEKKSNLNSSMM